MEQRTIGKFISALRKAEGMTQKDLAERLNVSDKTVSRWERDEGAPDISMIPVIAEIFGVTCDELLRGERTPQAQRQDNAAAEITAKADKQRRRLLKSALSRYISQSCISMGLSVVGFIAALIANLAFLRAILGCLLGAIFLVAAIVCQAIFMNKAFLSVEDAELDSRDILAFKIKVIRMGIISIGLAVTLFGCIFPLAFVGAYLGMGAGSMFIYGSISGGVFLLIYSIVIYFIDASLIRKGTIVLDEKEEKLYYRRHRLKRNTALALTVVLLITAGFHYSSTVIWGPNSIMEGIVFEDYESFIAYMEQDVPMTPRSEFGGGTTAEEIVSEPAGDVTYYDVEGNEITEEEWRLRTIEDENGNVVCEYTENNENVCSISYSTKEGSVLPITVYTYDELYRAEVTAEARNKLFVVGYIAELLAAFAAYFVIKKAMIK